MAMVGWFLHGSLLEIKRTRLSFIERQLMGYEDEMFNRCLGTLPELFDGNPPFLGRGAISFAVNVAEILRLLDFLDTYKYKQ